MATLIIIFIVLVLALIFLPFFKDLVKDNEDLSQSPIEVRFKVLIEEINKAFLEGTGHTVYPIKNDRKWLNLHSSQHANYLIQFNYSTGHLTIYLNYKYLHKELKDKVAFYNVRNVDIFAQKRMANEFIQKMTASIAKHQQSVSIPNQSGPIPSRFSGGVDDPINLVSSMYGDLSMHQRRSVINMGYLIFSADGSSWNEYIKHAAVIQQLNFMNLDWSSCKSQLENEGENKIYEDLSGLEESIFTPLLMFCFSLTTTQAGPNTQRLGKFLSMNKRLGYSESEIAAIIHKVEAFMKYFGGK